MLTVTLAPFVSVDCALPPPLDGKEPECPPPPEHPAINIKPAAESAERRALFAICSSLVGCKAVRFWTCPTFVPASKCEPPQMGDDSQASAKGARPSERMRL
jgi:hypothetical protein